MLLGAVCLPAAEYSTYIGGPNPISISKMISDSAGNVYIAGSRTFPSSNNLSEAILIKLDPTGKTVLFATLSGKGNDVANAVAVDKAGNIYLAGQTSSPDFPLYHALFSASSLSISGYVGFIAKFNSDASQILYSTYFPGTVSDLTTDPAGNVYVTGTTTTSSFPVTAGLPAATIGGISRRLSMVHFSPRFLPPATAFSIPRFLAATPRAAVRAAVALPVSEVPLGSP